MSVGDCTVDFASMLERPAPPEVAGFRDTREETGHRAGFNGGALELRMYRRARGSACWRFLTGAVVGRDGGQFRIRNYQVSIIN